ncbi:MAG: GNAT family N-acetyltransferase [Phycisphaerae bacterium]|nr:GNAT family N-acetyltransferase [Phycisphaerae bacterium]
MSAVAIRRATREDIERVAELAGQLGYPSGVEAMAARYEVLDADPDRVLVVATLGDRVVGWMEYGVRESFLSGRHAEIAGLVVDGTARRSGIGRALVQWAESEAKARGLSRLRLTSNAQRVEAASFYPALGFTQTKLSRVFEKAIG